MTGEDSLEGSLDTAVVVSRETLAQVRKDPTN